jgi:alpha-tubulin suppressor-like RCC1 family protein
MCGQPDDRQRDTVREILSRYVTTALRRHGAGGAAGLLAVAVVAVAAPAASAPASAAARPAHARPQVIRPAVAAGAVRGWGLNHKGEIGNGTSGEGVFTPAAVHLSAGTMVKSVRIGCEQAAAVTTAGDVLTWGDNTSGQLGTGSSDGSSPIPVQVALPFGTTAASVRVGCGNNLALTAAGRVWAWGSGGDGELGNGTNDSTATPVAVPMAPGTKVTAVTAGGATDFALTASGQVLSWGFGGDGELGNGARNSSNVPVRVRLPKGVKVTSIAAGFEHVLARTAAGGVLAWGANTQGQLGNGFSGGFADVPVRVRLPKGVKVRALFAGCVGSLALTSTGQVLAWGNNQAGQLGNGKTGGFSDVPVPVKMPKGTTVAEISAGCLDNMARTTSGRVLSWGANSLGQLGNGNTTAASSSHPVRVKLPASQVAVAIGAGPVADGAFAILRPAPTP